MKSPVQKPVFRIALCAVVAGLAVAVMLLTALLPVGTYALPVFAGALLIAVVVEYGAKWAFGVYAVAAVLSFFVAADKEAALYFAMFFGYYPVLKSLIERKIMKKPLCLLVKLAVFNVAAVASFFLATLVLGVPISEFSLFGVNMPLVFLLIGNVFFLFYDRALTIFAVFYVRKLRDKLFRGVH
ncbi:MAG: hypothetical protein IJ598_04560 [Ruminococcus sp.]|nr:hypothetical protein [Ruminococcus sp.]